MKLLLAWLMPFEKIKGVLILFIKEKENSTFDHVLNITFKIRNCKRDFQGI
jgi:hypothetical protein